MSLVDLTKEIIVALCTDKDSVNVKEFDTDDEKTNWQKAETNDIVYEHDKVDMNMFRDDQEN